MSISDPRLVHSQHSSAVVLDDETIHDVIQWDVMTWRRCLPFWEAQLLHVQGHRPRVLLLGERDGGLALWYALRGYLVHCTDLHGPTERAQELHRRYGVVDQISYGSVDVFNIAFNNDTFDIVGCKSVIGGLKRVYVDSSTRTLENQSVAVAEIRRVLRTGGVFLGAENLVGSPLHRSLRYVAKRGNVGWRHLALPELVLLLSGFERVTHEEFGFVGTRGPVRPHHAILKTVDDVLRALLPRTWAYVACFGAWKGADVTH